MNVLSFTEVRSDFKSVLDAVCKNHEPTIVTRVGGEHVVMLSLDDFNGMQETMYLLSSINNANRLRESIAQLRAGQAKPRDLIPHDQPQSKE